MDISQLALAVVVIFVIWESLSRIRNALFCSHEDIEEAEPAAHVKVVQVDHEDTVHVVVRRKAGTPEDPDYMDTQD